MNSVLNYVLYFFFYSFLGWIGETIYCSVGEKKFVNRGFLTGPLCPIYGTGATVFAVCLMPFYNKFGFTKWYIVLLVVLLGMILADVVEFLTSLIMEKLFNARWWDYSNKKFNIQGRICLGHTMYWGIATGLFIYVLHPRVVDMFASMLRPRQRNEIIIMIFAVFAVDLFFAVKSAFDVRKFISKVNKLYDSVSETASTIKSSMTKTYENIHESVEKNSFRFAVWASDISRQISDIENPFKNAPEEKPKKKHFVRRNANRLYHGVGNIQKSTSKKIQSLRDIVKDLNDEYFNDNNNKT